MMPVTAKNKKLPGFKGAAELDNSVRDYGNDPYFVRKGEEAKKFLDRVGLPEEVENKKKK